MLPLGILTPSITCVTCVRNSPHRLGVRGSMSRAGFHSAVRDKVRPSSAAAPTAAASVIRRRGVNGSRPRHIHLVPHLTDDELHDRYRCARDPVERSHWHFLWLLAGGMTATAVTAVTGYSAYCIGRIARRYNTDGPDDMQDRRHAICTAQPDLPAAQLTELGAILAGPHPEGDRWCGRTVAQWLAKRLGRQVSRQLGWRSLWRLGAPLAGATTASCAGQSPGAS